MDNHIENIIQLSAQKKIRAKFWAKAGKKRLYANANRRDANVYLDIDDSHSIGAELFVFMNTKNTTFAWREEQANAIRELFRPLLLAYVYEMYVNNNNVDGPNIPLLIAEAKALFEGETIRGEIELSDEEITGAFRKVGVSIDISDLIFETGDLETFESSQKFSYTSKDSGEVEGYKYTVFDNAQEFKGQTRRMISVIDFGGILAIDK